jgi:hypothetical protein
MSRRYVTLAILGVACIVGYGISKGWFGSGSREVESEGAATGVSESTDQIDVPPLALPDQNESAESE